MEETTDNGNSWSFGGVDWGSFFRSGGTPGGVDVFFSSEGAAERVAGLVLVALLGRDKRGVHAYPFIRVVLPGQDDINEDVAWGWLAAACDRVMDRRATEADWAAMRRRVGWSRPSSLSVAALVDAIDIERRGALTIIMDAWRYQADVLPTDIGSPDRSTRSLDPPWAFHLERLVAACAARVTGTASLIVVDVGDDLAPGAPVRHAFDQMPDVAIFSVHRSEGTSAMALAQRAMALALVGDVNGALAQLDTDSSVSHAERRVIQVQVLARSGDTGRAVVEARAIVDAGIPLNPPLRVSFASLASRAGEQDLVRQLLTGLPVGALSAELAKVVWALARAAGLHDVAASAGETLHHVFPHPDGIHPDMLDALRALCSPREPDPADQVLGLPGVLADIGRWLRQHFPDEEAWFPGVVDVARSTFPDFSNEVQLCLASGALERGWFNMALMAFDPPALHGRAAVFAAWQLLEAMERYLVARAEARAPLDVLSDAVGRLIAHLASHPSERKLFIALEQLLEPQTSGDLGFIVLVFNAIDLVESPQLHPAWPEAQVEVEPASPDELLAFMTAAANRVHPDQPLSTWTIPPPLLVPSADALLATVVNTIDEQEREAADARDGFIGTLVGLGCALARASSLPHLDLTLLRFYGERLARDGAVQKSRDIAETLLQLVDGDATRARLAWFGFGDIYLRGSNTMEGLLGVVCGMATHAPMPDRDASDEVFAVMRALRDAGLPDLASRFAPIWLRAQERAGVSSVDVSRAQTAQLSLRMGGFLRTGGRDGSGLDTLLADAAGNLRSALDLDDSPLPAMLILGQLIDHTGRTNPAWSALIEEGRSRLPLHLRAMYDLAAGEVTGPALIAFLTEREQASYRQDVGYDLDGVMVAARRLLDVAGREGDSEAATFATELLTDIALPVLGAASPRDSWWPPSVDDVALTAGAVVHLGVDVVTLGMSQRRHLAEVRFKCGEAPRARLMETSEFSAEYYHEWSQTYPYAYGLARGEFDNTFFQTMERIGPGLFPEGPTVYVCDVRLLRLAPNLFLQDSTFAGTRFSVGVAPSLTWLSAALAREQTPLAPPVVWISDADDSEASNTLNFVAATVEASCQAFGIPLLRDVSPPALLQNAELAIVGAHGGLGEENRFFRVVADEGQTRLTSSALASALHGARVVVLFVCSGGRVENHPLVSGTVGLPKALLEAACEVVIASPWPLDAAVPGNWLPAFLRQWHDGATVMDATFAANAAVASRMGVNPANALAMTVYGNPLARRWEGDGDGQDP